MDLFQMCRVCLALNDNLLDLYKPRSNGESPSIELMEHTSLLVSPDDGFPNYICKDCFQTLLSIKKFKEVGLNSDTLLRSYNGPYTLQNFSEYITSIQIKENEGIWYIDKDEVNDLEITDLSNKGSRMVIATHKLDKYMETKDLTNIQDLKMEVITKEKIDELDKFIEKQLEILQGPSKTKFEEIPQVVEVSKILLEESNNPYVESLTKVETTSILRKSVKKIQNSVCHICGKLVKHLDVHITVHKKTLDIKCQFCGKLFRHNAQLRKHLVVHNGEKKHYCSICNMSFTRSEVRNRHVKTIHESNRNHKCTVCNKAFQLYWRLKIHMNTHTGEKRYKCDMEGCTKGYNQRKLLLQHKLKCNTKIICVTCNETFTNMLSLKQHRINKHNFTPPNTESLYPCELCDLIFVTAHRLYLHKKSHRVDNFLELKCEICTQTFSSERGYKRHVNDVHGDLTILE